MNYLENLRYDIKLYKLRIIWVKKKKLKKYFKKLFTNEPRYDRI